MIFLQWLLKFSITHESGQYLWNTWNEKKKDFLNIKCWIPKGGQQSGRHCSRAAQPTGGGGGERGFYSRKGCLSYDCPSPPIDSGGHMMDSPHHQSEAGGGVVWQMALAAKQQWGAGPPGPLDQRHGGRGNEISLWMTASPMIFPRIQPATSSSKVDP